MRTVPVRSPSGILAAKVDDEDYEYLAQFRWGMAGGKGSRGKYAARRAIRSTVYMHREVAHRMGLIELVAGSGGGSWTVSVDHANGDRLDNQRSNLSLKNRAQQMRNRGDRLRSTNHSGYRGVTFDKSRNLWSARVTVNYRTINIGRYPTVEAANEARLAWESRTL